MTLKVGKQREWVKNLTGKQKLVPLIERAIDGPEFEWEAKFGLKGSDDAWHPSGDCTPSLYDLYHKALGTVDRGRFPVSLKKTFQVGHFWHAYLQWVCVEVAELCPWGNIEQKGANVWGHDIMTPDEAKLRMEAIGWPFGGDYDSDEVAVPRPYHWATGSMDMRCEVPGHSEYVVDFKTMNGRDFATVTKGQVPDWCGEKYEAQINMYMDWANVENALIVCVQKDSPHTMREIEYRRHQPLIDAIYDKWKIVGECLTERVEPPEDEEFALPFTGPRS